MNEGGADLAATQILQFLSREKNSTQTVSTQTTFCETRVAIDDTWSDRTICKPVVLNSGDGVDLAQSQIL